MVVITFWSSLQYILLGALTLASCLTGFHQFLTTVRSQFRRQRSISIVCSLTLFSIGLFTVVFFSAWGEGSTIAMDGRGVASATKDHGMEPRLVLGPTCYAKTPRKRSYVRALRRASKFGFTWHKGRLIKGPPAATDEHFNNTSLDSSCNTTPSRNHLRKRLTCFSWNSSGLATAKYDFVMQWLTNNPVDLAFVQETHWNLDSEWSHPAFFCHHSGHSGHQAGLLCLVSKRLCSMDRITSRVVIPGRLVHLRLHGDQRSTDIVHVYQHVHSHDRMSAREDFWHHLNDLLTSLPKRNFLILVGDFNTSLPHRSLMVGTGTYLYKNHRHSGTAHSDSDVFHQLLRQHSIQTLNTWSHHLGPTYINEDVHSRLDFVCCRRVHSDATAQDVQYLDNFPLCMDAGSHHVPILTSMLRQWIPRSTTPPSSTWSHSKRLQLYKQWTKQDSTAFLLQQQVNLQVNSCVPSGHPLDSLHEAMNQSPQFYINPSSSTPTHNFDLTPFQAFSFHGDALRNLSGTTSRSILQAWFHLMKLRSSRRAMNKTSKAARRAKLQLVFDQADAAERANDHFHLYQAIRKISPKQFHQRVTLRHPDGSAASPSQAADMLAQWLDQLYKADPHVMDYQFQPWPFSMDEFCQGLQSLPLMKSLAPTYAPAPYWVMSAEAVTAFLAPFFQQWFDLRQLPQAWSMGHLVFLPKPGRTGGRPQDLRPISLLEPTGKTIMGLAAKALYQEAAWFLHTVPQFAYLHGRGCNDAITRVVQHCAQVRSLLQTCQYPIHASVTGSEPAELVGGLLLSLDLSRAFDEVNRSFLFASMHEIGISPAIIQLIHLIYSQTGFTFNHRSETRQIGAMKGIRQGCKCAPIMWSLFTAFLMAQLSDHCTWEHIQRYLTAFADDFCYHQIFHSYDGFERAVRMLGHLMDCLTTHGLLINVDKTVVICRFLGRKSSLVQKKFIVRNSQGTFLRIPRAHGSFTMIKMVREYSYLGIKLSYGNYQKLTLHHRLTAGRRAQMSLHKWLHLKSGLSAYQRVKIWRQCVLTCMFHGVIHTGFGHYELTQLRSQCLQQIRRLFHSPVYVTR